MDKHVLVFGSYVTDLCCRTNTIPQLGETVKGHYFKLGPGGKGSNQAVAAKRAGADLTFVTKLGDDSFGMQALEFYKAEGISQDGILIGKGEQTGVALIIVDEASAQNQILVVSGACGHFLDEDMPNILKLTEQTDILLLQLETNIEPVKRVLQHAHKRDVLTILNPAPAQRLDRKDYQCVDIITPNETEAELLTGIPVSNTEGAAKAARVLMEWGVGKVIVTLGENGAYACDGTNERIFDIVDCGAVVDTTGAGDAFSGGVAAALSRGLDFFQAAAYGCCAAGLAVTRHGTAPAMPYQEEIDRVFANYK